MYLYISINTKRAASTSQSSPKHPPGRTQPPVRPTNPPAHRPYTAPRTRRIVSIYIPVAGNTDDCRARARQYHYLLDGLLVCMGTFPFPTLPSSTWILGRNGRPRRYAPPSPDDVVHDNRGGAVAEQLCTRSGNDRLRTEWVRRRVFHYFVVITGARDAPDLHCDHGAMVGGWGCCGGGRRLALCKAARSQ